ncbi:MAG: hypothetical protein LBK71_03310 [Verrucomicrobiales bacterium]|jgi:major type 1 subunit fimbrin (pilin)|nr:hypothetical protein [Verrucomicrobiales bacterium]
MKNHTCNQSSNLLWKTFLVFHSQLEPQSAIRNPQSAIRNPQSAIRNPQSAIRNPQSAIRNPPLTVNPFSPSATRALTVSGCTINSPRGRQPIITACYAANGKPVAIIKMVAAPLYEHP